MVTTAVWFRSRFIVVANFLMFVAIIVGYVAVAERETGISIGFGIVALASARILNWQRDRLELKTELMRNAYLIGAFLVLPYALYHLVPGKYIGLAWVGLALVYYVLNLVVQNRKYRWMGHATLLMTACYLAVVGTRQFEPVYRIVSFLALVHGAADRVAVVYALAGAAAGEAIGTTGRVNELGAARVRLGPPRPKIRSLDRLRSARRGCGHRVLGVRPGRPVRQE